MKLKSFKFFYPEKPRLMSIDQPLFRKLSEDPNWIAERKYNEIRLELHKNGSFRFWNRHEQELDYRPSDELLEALNSIPLLGYCLLDGGLRHNKVPGIKHQIVFYDLFAFDGEMLLKESFHVRRKRLEGLLSNVEGPVSLPEQFPGDFEKVFKEVIKDPEIEGLVMKNQLGRLNLGR